MVRVTFIAADGREQPVAAREGLSLMEAAMAGGVDGIDAVCGSGRKPFRAITYMNSVAAIVRNVTTSVARWRCSTHNSVR